MQRVSELWNRPRMAMPAGVPPSHRSICPRSKRSALLDGRGYPATRVASLMEMDLTAVLTLKSGIIRKFDGNHRFQA